MFFVLIRCRVSKRNGVRPLLFLLERSKTSINRNVVVDRANWTAHVMDTLRPAVGPTRR